MKKIIVFIAIMIMAAMAVSGFSSKISYIGIAVSDGSGDLYNGTYEVTSYFFYDSSCEGTPDYTEAENVSIFNGNFGTTVTYSLYLDTTFYIKPSIDGDNQTCFEYTPSAQSIKSGNSTKTDFFRSYTPTTLPIAGDVSGTLSSSQVDMLTLNTITYSGLLGFNNLTKCTGTQILKMSGGSWACDTDSTGSDTTCSDVACTIGDDDTISNVNIVQNNTGTWNVNISCENIQGGSDADYCADDSGTSSSKWITDQVYIYNDTDTIYLNETSLNATVIILTDERDTDTTCDSVACTLNDDTLELSSLIYSGTLGIENLTVCGEGEVLKIDSSVWSCRSDLTGASTSKWITDQVYIYNDTDTAYLNETRLNLTIIAITDERDTDTDTDTLWALNATVFQNETTGNLGVKMGLWSSLFVALGTKLGNSSAEIQAAELDAAHDTCAEVTGCVQNALTSESDPQVGLTTANKLCEGNGTGLNCNITWSKFGNSTAEIIYAANASGVTYQFSVSGTAVATSDSTWTLHNSYPTACSGTSFVQAIDDTLTCAIPTYSQWPINATVFQNETGNLGVKMGLWDGLFVNAISDTMSGNLTLEAIHFEADANNHYIADNTTCIIIKGDTSLLEIC